MKLHPQALLFICFAAVATLIGYNLYDISTRLPERPYSEFLSAIEAGRIQKVSMRSGVIKVHELDDSEYTTFSPDVPNLIQLMRQQDIEISTTPPSEHNGLIRDLGIVILLLGGWLIFSRKSIVKPTSFTLKGRRAKKNDHTQRVTFNDVAGISEAREELREIISFLRNPAKLETLGGRIPKGVLMEGPPGTGKTLLAKAIAGEASVPFYPIGGSDFVEMYAGLGASRVRELFSEAKKNAPCILFIDEIDAIGAKRTNSQSSGTNDEREQTLNALLVELDGFNSDDNVIVIAATNRADVLDSALLRPGRFDRKIVLTLPDIKGRLKILEVHCRKVTTSKNLDLTAIARSIPGFSGAEIANLVNEAALLAARREKKSINELDFQDAKDKIIMGIERKSAVISEQSRRLAAYHEAGHAITALMLPETDPLHKITIIPRGRSLGLTQQLPFKEHLTFSRTYLVNRIKILMGGRQAEELIFGTQTSGASNDIVTATDIASKIVCDFGMSKHLGPVSYSHLSNNVDNGQNGMLSEETIRDIDQEIKQILSTCCHETTAILKRNDLLLHMLAESLLVNETLDADEIDIVHRCYTNQKTAEKNQHHLSTTGGTVNEP